MLGKYGLCGRRNDPPRRCKLRAHKYATDKDSDKSTYIHELFFLIREAYLHPFREISLSLGKAISILPSAGRILGAMSSKV